MSISLILRFAIFKQSLIACCQEKGTILSGDKKDKTILNEGEVPQNLREKKTFISKIGVCCVARASKLRYGSLFHGKRIGYYLVNDTSQFLDISDVNLINKTKDILNYKM